MGSNFAKTESLSLEQLISNLVQRAIVEAIGELTQEVADTVRREVRAALAEKAVAHTPTPEWLSVQKVAKAVGVHEDTVRSWIHERRLKASQDEKNGKYRVRRSDLDVFMEGQPARGPASLDVDSELDRIMNGSRLLKTGS